MTLSIFNHTYLTFIYRERLVTYYYITREAHTITLLTILFLVEGLSYLVCLVAETDELALQVDLVHCDAAAGRGVLTNAGLGHSATRHAGGLTVVVVEAPLLGAGRAGGVAAARGGG